MNYYTIHPNQYLILTEIKIYIYIYIYSIERETIKSFDDFDIIRTFIAKRSRKGHLPPNFI